MIFYFSGTGNSLYVARRIAERSRDNCQDLSQAVREGAYEYALRAKEPLGLVLPVYYWGIPAQAELFLSRLKLTGAQQPYTFVVFTCGGAPCNAVSFIKKHLSVNYWNWVTMPDNMVIKYDVKHRDEQRACLTGADLKLKDIMKAIARREESKKGADLFGQLATRVFYPKYDKQRVTAPFHTDSRCTGCGQCAAICPEGIIELNDGLPRWTANKCSLCLACLNRCPEAAIQYGKSTAKHGRYFHPILTDSYSPDTETSASDPRFDF